MPFSHSLFAFRRRAIPIVACSSSDEDGPHDSSSYARRCDAVTHSDAKRKSETVGLDAAEVISWLIARCREEGIHRFQSSPELSNQWLAIANLNWASGP